MSVVSEGKFIFCEGKKTSLDYQLLSRIVENISTNQLTIIPAGSKFTFSIFAQGYFFHDETQNPNYIIFRDRDFDKKPTSNVQLLQPGENSTNRKTFLTYRSCIENYLLNPNLIDQYWQEKYQHKEENPNSKWDHGNSPGINIISEWIENSARSLQEYQSVRWALGDLLSMSAARKQLKTTWTKGSGKLPQSLSRQECKTQALVLINQFLEAVGKVTVEEFETRLSDYQQRFTQESFWQQKQYLIWFHGKDIQKKMNREKPKYISVTSDNFLNWAINNLDLTQYPDLQQLQSKIEEL